MREIDVTSSYIQAMGRIEGNSLTCTSLSTQSPIDVGPPTLTTANGAVERTNVWIFKSQTDPLLVVSKGGFAFLLDTSLAEDVSTEGPGILTGLFVPSNPSHGLISAQSNGLHAAWLRPIPKGTAATFLESGYVVSVVRAQDIDLAAVAAVPQFYVTNRVGKFALIFVPLGLLCAAGLVWAVGRISRAYLSLPSVLRIAARNKEFFVEYQPIVELKTGRWIGAEALVRWQRGGEIITPDSFIPTAEESGVITLITARVAEIVAADLPALLKIDPGFLVAINLSAADLRSTQTIEMLKRMIASDGIRAANISVEATERGFLQGKEARDLLAAIRELGIEVAIDDFGTGYSSLSCLQTLGLDALKIDKSFVETIDTDGATSQVVPHIIGMAHSLNLTMVAEGVETEEQADFLRTHEVHYAQGWLFAKPMGFASLCTRLKSEVARKHEVVV